MSRDCTDVCDALIGCLAPFGFHIPNQSDHQDEVLSALDQCLVIPIPRPEEHEGEAVTYTIPDPLPDGTLAWTIQYVEWQETWDSEPFIRIGLEYDNCEIQLDDEPANGWTVVHYADDIGATMGSNDAQNAFRGRFGEDAEFRKEHLDVLTLHLKDLGYQGMKLLWKGKTILLENVEMVQHAG